MAAIHQHGPATKTINAVRTCTRSVPQPNNHQPSCCNLWEHAVSKPRHPPHARGRTLWLPGHHHPWPPGKTLDFTPQQLPRQESFLVLQKTKHWMTHKEKSDIYCLHVDDETLPGTLCSALLLELSFLTTGHGTENKPRFECKTNQM